MPDTRALVDPQTRLTPIQERAIAALINEPSIAKAALSAGVGLRTLHRWLRVGPFVEEYRRRRRDVFHQSIGLAQRYAPLALQTLAKALVDTEAPYACRVQAATAILRFARESLELDDLAQRVSRVEAGQAINAE